MRLYVWEDVLTDYTAGMAFAIADSKKEAIELVIKSIGIDSPRIRSEFENSQPKAHKLTSKVAYHVWGGG